MTYMIDQEVLEKELEEYEILSKYREEINRSIKESIKEFKTFDQNNIMHVFALFSENYKQGFILGFREGKAEEKIEIAKNLLHQNIDLSIISSSTGLPESDLLKLKEEL